MRNPVQNSRDGAALREPNFGDLLGAPKRPRRSFEAPRRTKKEINPQGGMSRLRMADILAGLVAAAAVLLVIVNALSLQQASRPAPVTRPIAATPVQKKTTPAPLPPVRPDAPKRTATDLMLDIQRELASRGFYNGAEDGIAGPRALQAIRDFERANGLKVTGDPSEALLEKIRHSLQKSDITGSIAPAEKAPLMSSRIGGVQRMLARYGFGPVRINGEMDTETHAAIRRFERDRDMPATGEVSDRLERELAAYSGNKPD